MVLPDLKEGTAALAWALEDAVVLARIEALF